MAVVVAKQLVRAAPGTREAREARYYAFRLLQILGEAEKAEVEFDAHFQDIAAIEGEPAARKFLEDEGLREDRERNSFVALRRFQRLLALAKGRSDIAAVAHARMANVYARLHQGDLATREWKKAVEIGPPPGEAWDCYDYLWRTSYCNGEYQEAERYAKELLSLDGSPARKANDEVRLAMVVEKTEGPLKAAQLYRQIIAKYPEGLSTSARIRLKEIEK